MGAIPSLKSINFHLIKACNENCHYCFKTFRDIPSKEPQLRPDEAEELITRLAAAGTEKITFVGGEPTLYKELPRLVRKAHDLGITTVIVSNGFRLAEVMNACSDAIDWIGLSVDSGREDVQQALGRGGGRYVAASESLIAMARRLGIKTKLNTVVTALNWQEDMSGFVRRCHPDRWKVFQVLAIKGQNDGMVEPLLITKEQFRAFVERHAHLAAEGLEPVAEDNDAMTGSYLMIDPLGRFHDDVDGRLRYSRPILEVGIDTALQEIRFDFTRLKARGGLYEWSRSTMRG